MTKRKDIDRQLLDLYEKGLTRKEIAQILHVHISTVTNHAKQLGISFIREEYPPRKFTIQQLRDLHALGFSKLEIARTLHVNVKTVDRHARRNKIPLIHGNRKFSDQQLIDLQKSGLTMKEAAKQLGVSYQTICNHARRLNLKFRFDDTSKARRKFSDELFLKLLNDGLTKGEIAKTLVVSLGTLRRRARLLDVSFTRVLRYTNPYGLQRMEGETPKEYHRRYYKARYYADIEKSRKRCRDYYYRKKGIVRS